MSLDVYLRQVDRCPHCGQFIGKGGIVYESNITHNLGKMAAEAGIYETLWRPEEVGYKTAGDLIPSLTLGLEKLRADPQKYKEFEPENGWGTYDGLVRFTCRYLQACKDYPHSLVEVSR